MLAKDIHQTNQFHQHAKQWSSERPQEPLICFFFLSGLNGGDNVLPWLLIGTIYRGVEKKKKGDERTQQES